MDNTSATTSAPPSVEAPAAPPPAKPPQRYDGIDGLRAVAALWVFVFHAGAAASGHLWPGIDLLVRSGSTGVSLFLVLSGLCLYLPYAAGRHDRFTGRSFFTRRIRRLMPAYLASLVILLIAHAAFGGRFGMPDMDRGELAAQTITHLTMTHSLFPETFYGINGGYWSLGLEWQLYLTLPLLIAAAVKFGIGRTVVAVFAVTAIYRLSLFAAGQFGLLDPEGAWATVVLPNTFLGRWSEFALGMLAAHLLRTHQLRVRWPLLVGAALMAVLALVAPDNPLKHMVFGVVFFTLVVVVLVGDNPVARFFSWRPLVAIGVVSYSLYLVHQPVLALLESLIDPDGTGDPRTVFLILLALFPVTMAFALLLFAGVERWSMVRKGVPVPTMRQLLLPVRPEPEAHELRVVGHSHGSPHVAAVPTGVMAASPSEASTG